MTTKNEIDKLIRELTTLRSHKGDTCELDTLIGQAARVVEHFNEVNDVQAKAIEEWAHENDDIERIAKKALDDMNDGKIGSGFYL